MIDAQTWEVIQQWTREARIPDERLAQWRASLPSNREIGESLEGETE